jgi:phosphatidylserine/phosphatidylglycerophosphate/cardiolipin synthase-like enzyme
VRRLLTWLLQSHRPRQQDRGLSLLFRIVPIPASCDVDGLALGQFHCVHFDGAVDVVDADAPPAGLDAQQREVRERVEHLASFCAARDDPAMRRTTIPVVVVVLISAALLARERTPETKGPAVVEGGIAVFFSPKGGCTDAVVEAIGHAKKSVDMQAYSFTSYKIGEALAQAQARGVKVRAIIDKKEAKEQNKEPDYIAAHGVPTWTDGEHSIAHNKIIIIDRAIVLEGSFNFTQQAETSNAENLNVIQDHPKLAAAYEENFEKHLKHSEKYASRLEGGATTRPSR